MTKIAIGQTRGRIPASVGAVGVPLDGDPSSDDRTSFDGGESFEELTDVGNETKDCSVGFDMSFYGVQSHQNDGTADGRRTGGAFSTVTKMREAGSSDP